VIATTAADVVPTFLSHQPDESFGSPVACILLDCRLIKSHPFAVPAFDQRLDLCKGKRRVSACLLQPKADRLSDRRQADASARERLVRLPKKTGLSCASPTSGSANPRWSPISAMPTPNSSNAPTGRAARQSTERFRSLVAESRRDVARSLQYRTSPVNPKVLPV
jgi:hypothetical protein